MLKKGVSRKCDIVWSGNVKMGKCKEAGQYKKEVYEINIGTRQNNAKLYSAGRNNDEGPKTGSYKRVIKYEEKARRSDKKLVVDV